MPKRRFLLPVFCVLFSALILTCRTPERRAARYVEARQEELQADMDGYFSGESRLIYHGSAFSAVNHWDGRHPMVEYLFTGPGHHGFYYSLDDVPLAFQNADLPLAEADGGWQWRGEGGKRGFTRRLSPCWYYFEAQFGRPSKGSK